MKTLFIILSLLIVMPLLSFRQDFKEPEQLDWAIHFKGKPDNNSPFYALTAMTWKYSYASTVYRNRVEIKLQNEISIDRNRSWVKLDKVRTEEGRQNLLHHEQGHVNIQYILYLEADRVLKNRNYSVKTYKTQISQLANEISNYFDTMQKNYDEETEHGSNHKMQAEWDRIISDKMEESIAASNSK
ncbi:DUF922 domain-containing protein [Pedobacter rhodius]|uniref:DUF922 domain-containing protein n=1 Tax=Pedobacter rhodius TaxID=3004098 RepID=A0ABT4KUC6_9SPHI|nr:DUF922 domain-containing protein [Pedobacter sp. SJ11]MCZ4222346.1 DUF922 domain-containing protein [Pedobacter sp. SJ11]